MQKNNINPPSSSQTSIVHAIQTLWGKPWLAISLILLVTTLIHHSAFQNDFYWDDRSQILDAKLTDSWTNIPTIFTSEVWRNVEHNQRLQHATIDTYRPMFNLSLLIDNQLFGHAKWWHHGVNLFIHLANIVSMFLLAGLLFEKRVALWIAAIFSLHPTTVTCIHYVSARPDSLATLFALLAIWLALKPAKSPSINYIFSGVCFLLAFLSKEAVLLLPFWVLMASWVTHPKKNYRVLLIQGAFFFLSIAGYFLLRLNALGAVKATENASHIFEILQNFPMVLITTLRVALFQISPLPLREFHVTVAPYSFLQWAGLAVFYLLLLAFVSWILIKKKAWPLGIVWILVSMAPPTVAITKTSVLNSFYMYTATAGIAMGMGVLLERLSNQKRIRQWLVQASFFAILFTAATLSYISAQNFRTEVQFYTGIISAGPHDFTAEYNLGNAYLRQNRINSAIGVFEKILHSKHSTPQIHNNLAIAYLRQGNFSKSQTHSAIAVKNEPQNEKYRYNLGIIFMKQKKWNLGLQQLEKSLKINPKYESARILVEQFCSSQESAPFRIECNRIITPEG